MHKKERNEIGMNNRKGMNAANNGNFDLALDLLATALGRAREIDDQMLVAVTKNNMALAMQMAGRDDDARATYLAALRLAEAQRGEGHPLPRFIRTNLERMESAGVSRAA
jgi:tetratricopeptide (TPR) repeat protein